ncbi:MAG TPA: hypothetical protein VF103_02135 [Polyangiaceae bacterium]
MKTSLFVLGFLAVGLSQCSGDKGIFVGEERGGTAGEGGDTNETGGSSTTGGSGGASSGAAGSENRGGTESSGGTNDRGGTGTGAEGGAGAEPGTGGTGGTDTGGTGTGGVEQGGTDAGGSAGDVTRGGAGGMGAQAGSGTAARGGANDGGRAGSGNAGTGGRPSDVDCEAMAREYQDRLAAVQQCMFTGANPCSLKIADDLFCGCPTFVSPVRADDIRRMQDLLEKASSCQRVCPAIACHNVTRGVCTADAIVPAGGRCVAMP